MKRIAFGFLSIWLVLSTSAQTSHLVTTLFPTGPGSLGHYITNSSSGDTIRFDSNLFLNGSDTLYTGSPFVFSHGLVIEGYMNNGDTLYISGMGQSQIFMMDFTNVPQQDVSLKQIAVINGHSITATGVFTTYGGGIYASDLRRLNLENCLIRNCQSKGIGRGGGISVRFVDTLSVQSSIFQLNLADSTSGVGGALLCSNTHLKAINSRFEFNYSGRYGGAISSISGYALIRNCDFISNATVNPSSTDVMGGAFDNAYGPFPIFNGCRFIGNRSEGRGGAISIASNYASPMVVNRCLFEDNSSDNNGSVINSLFSNSNATITNSSFINNYSSLVSGAAINLEKCTISNSTFIENQTSTTSALKIEQGNVLRSTVVSSVAGQPLIKVSADSLVVANSILSHVPGGVTIDQPQYAASTGYNIFSDNPPFVIPSDTTLVDSVALALLPLGNYGGFAPTRPPGPGSVALNTGNAFISTPAQNGPIFIRSDVGAAEYQYIIRDTALSCGPTTWWGNVYAQEGSYQDTLFTGSVIDSIGILVLQPLHSQLTNQGGVLTAANQPANAMYQWVYCDSNHAPVPNATAASFLPATNGSYALVSTYGNCTDTSVCVSYNEVSTQDLNPSKSLRFYPNPTTGRIHVQSSGEQQPKRVAVLDLNGRQLAVAEVVDHVVELPELATGIYLLRWELSNGTVQVDRVSIQN